MAISSNGGNGGAPSGSGGGFRRRRGGSSLAEINITPFVDVMLVLLIIFMLTAHVMEFGLQVDVPKVAMVKDSAEQLPVVSLTRDGTTYLNETPPKSKANSIQRCVSQWYYPPLGHAEHTRTRTIRKIA